MGAWPSERTARWLLVALVLVAPVVLGARLLFGARVDAPLFPRPSATDLVVVTFGSWWDPQAVPVGPAFAHLERRGQRVGPVWAASDCEPAAAATLWTGRLPPAHGLRRDGERLPTGTWNLAAAARAAGTHTAAFLAEPLVTATGLEGFDELVEDGALGAQELGARGRSFLLERRGERVLLWLHASSAGDAGAAAELLLAEVLAGLAESGREGGSVLVVTAFANARADAVLEERLLVPFVTRQPAATDAGAQSTAALGQVDMAGFARARLRLAPPSTSAGQAPLQSRADRLWSAIRGGGSHDWNWIEGRFGEVVRLPDRRLHLAPDGSFEASRTSDPRAATGGTPISGQALPAARRLFGERRAQAAGR
jgi:hypothetical protein